MIFSFLLSWLRLLNLLLWRLLDYLIQGLWRNINIFDINVCGMLEGVDLANRSLDFIGKLMRTNALDDLILVVSQDDISL